MFFFHRIADSSSSPPQTLLAPAEQLTSEPSRRSSVPCGRTQPKACLCFALSSLTQPRCLARLATLTSAARLAASSAAFRLRVSAAASRRRRALSSFSAREAGATTRFASWTAADSSSAVRPCQFECQLRPPGFVAEGFCLSQHVEGVKGVDVGLCCERPQVCYLCFRPSGTQPVQNTNWRAACGAVWV